jgi:hypothetical protein
MHDLLTLAPLRGLAGGERLGVVVEELAVVLRGCIQGIPLVECPGAAEGSRVPPEPNQPRFEEPFQREPEGDAKQGGEALGELPEQLWSPAPGEHLLNAGDEVVVPIDGGDTALCFEKVQRGEQAESEVVLETQGVLEVLRVERDSATDEALLLLPEAVRVLGMSGEGIEPAADGIPPRARGPERIEPVREDVAEPRVGGAGARRTAPQGSF